MRPIADCKKPIETAVIKGKSVLVTGGASGLGALIAASFVEYGARVTIADLNKSRGEAFVQELGPKLGKLQFIQTDVTDWKSQVQAFKSAIAFSGSNSIDIVVASAGLPGEPFISDNEEPASLKYDPPTPKAAGPTLDVNAEGVYYTSKLAQHYFALLSTSEDPASYKKCLVLISSLAGYLEGVASDYTASKWAVRGLFRSIRSKMEDLSYRVNLIAPWVMDTPMSKDFATVCRDNGIPVGNAQDVADAVIRCAADESIYGRALAIAPVKTFDLRDDIEGLNAGIVMKEFLEGEAKGFMQMFGERP
ncbi:5'-hydroxyaverantin dehydrogenase [Physcia stellaris]|nr:5'-hydroxyaverantin dehydrogenase [Physcia stellaris]